MNKQKLLSEIMKREQKIAQLSKKINEYTSQKHGVQSELNELNRIGRGFEKNIRQTCQAKARESS